MTINIANPGTQNYYCQIRQQNINLEAGKTYRLSFEAYADADREIWAEIAESGVGGYDAFAGQIFNITTSPQRFQLPDFTMNVNYTNARINFYMRKDATTTHFDNIWLEEVNCLNDGCVLVREINASNIPSDDYRSIHLTHSSGTVNNGSTVNMCSEENIELKTGFEVKPQGELELRIENCINP